MIIYLMRHGETDWNKAGLIQGQVDIPLNAYGRELAEITSQALSNVAFEAVYCSPLQRAVETAYIVKRERHIPLREDKRLLEIGFAEREGSNIEQVMNDEKDGVHNFFEHPERYTPPAGAESFEKLYRRSVEFMEQEIFPLEKTYETILIVAHGALNRSIVNPILDISLQDFWSIDMPNCAVSLLELQNKKLKVLEKSRVYY